MRKILGIDPGFATIGFGLIAADRGSVQMLRYGAITTPAGMDFPQRLQLIYDDMTELLNLLKPDAVSIEELFFIRISQPAFRWPTDAGSFSLPVRNTAFRSLNIPPSR